MTNPYLEDEWDDDSPHCPDCYYLWEECICDADYRDDDYNYPDEPDEMPDFGGVTC